MKLGFGKFLNFTKIKEFLIQCKRTLKIARKPTKDELKKTLRICGIGFIIIGIIGFVFYLLSMLGLIAMGI
ncbi:MAG: protein translocase SEC61 complex subunit gamma [Candidatus Aenigmarchaeota archaeon]|nr:protein translocase SEC61 complex subunit gamma [Candidatus Aenigmarchaeota archaeon]